MWKDVCHVSHADIRNADSREVANNAVKVKKQVMEVNSFNCLLLNNSYPDKFIIFATKRSLVNQDHIIIFSFIPGSFNRFKIYFLIFICQSIIVIINTLFKKYISCYMIVLRDYSSVYFHHIIAIRKIHLLHKHHCL